MGKLNNLKNELRGISILDRVRASIFKYPVSIGDTCELYDQWLCDFLDSGADPVKTTKHEMTLSSDDGRTATFWVANYPYSYGNRSDVDTLDSHWLIYPRWDLVLRLRKLQLMNKQEVIEDYRNKMLIR